MTTQNKDNQPQQKTEDFLKDSMSFIEMPDDERSVRMKTLDAEISMLERAHMGTDDNPDLPSLSESEQRNLNWMLSWENFDRIIQNSSDKLALQFHTENNALANLALVNLNRSYGDNDTARDYLDKTKLIIKDYTAEIMDNSLNWEDKNPFQDAQLIELFKEQWFELANEQEPA